MKTTTTTSYKNAKIQSKKELATRLMNGEVFWIDGKKIFFDGGELDSPFRCGRMALDDYWDNFKDMEIENLWFNNIPKQGVICRVSDIQGGINDEQETGSIDTITSYTSGASLPFQSNWFKWRYAEPVKPEECYQG